MWLRPFQRRFIATVAGVSPQSLLEVGTGEGFLLERLHQRLPQTRMVGLDVVESFVNEGHRIFPHLDLRVGDIYHINEPDNSWDVVVASEILEHLDHPEEALRELKRVAKNYVVLSVPWEPFFRLGNLVRGGHLKTFGNHPEHINHWSAESFSKFVATEFQVEQVIRSMPWTIVLARV